MKFEEFKKRLTLRKILLLLSGMVIMNFGIAFSIQAQLGTSPVSSMPYTLSQFTGLTIGNWTIIIHIAAILLQILILRKNYNPINLCQIIIAFVFGYLTDFCVRIVGTINCPNYAFQWLICIIGTILIGIGVSFEVEANVMMVALEGLAYSISSKYNKKFGNVKSIQDLTLVIVACAVGLIAMGKIVGVREGTFFAAICVGQIAKIVKKLLFGKER